METSSCHLKRDGHLPRRRFLALMGAAGASAMFTAPGVAWAASHNVELSISGFGSDRRRVEQAFWLALDRSFQPRVIRLAGKNSYRSRGPAHDTNQPDDDVRYRRGQEAEEAISYYAVLALAPMLRMKNNGDCDFAISIQAANLGGNDGRAPVGLNTVWGYHLSDDRRRPRYSIELDRQSVQERSVDGTAGTIWHEMLHNAGLSHASGGSYEANYQGYFIKEWGLAVEANGQEGFGLIDDRHTRRGCG